MTPTILTDLPQETTVYTMLNNQESSKYDLYLPGRIVAALHYKLEPDANEVMFIYCEAIEPIQADQHRWELMWRAVEDAKSRRLKLTITCPIGLKALEQREPRADAGHRHAEEPRA
ncbi:hypothetical protein KTJ89_18130 [Brevibacterium sediminis]|uniref:hypothetical protein n=1 Tax=Brevibacterium sediminis TaxID=1857024 RepID=UPI002174F88A|nr:hypothetical protein [Brevibacterium sediminis]MCS4594915.1 hypothetical protein [Brevibacterium sediminis]